MTPPSRSDDVILGHEFVDRAQVMGRVPHAREELQHELHCVLGRGERAR